MSKKKEKFISFVQSCIDNVEAKDQPLDVDVFDYFEAFKATKESDKPKFTDNGKLILQFMKDNQDKLNNMFKAKDIAEGIFVSSRSVSGSVRKLVTDGFVEKAGQDPIIYGLTQLGKEVEIG